MFYYIVLWSESFVYTNDNLVLQFDVCLCKDTGYRAEGVSKVRAARNVESYEGLQTVTEFKG